MINNNKKFLRKAFKEKRSKIDLSQYQYLCKCIFNNLIKTLENMPIEASMGDPEKSYDMGYKDALKWVLDLDKKESKDERQST